jgi:hypothetical protein
MPARTFLICIHCILGHQIFTSRALVLLRTPTKEVEVEQEKDEDDDDGLRYWLTL